MKKGLLAAVIIVLCVAIGVGFTFAFYTQETKADNIITMGNIKAEVSSLTVDEGGEDVEFDGKIVSTVPGKKTPWKLSVKNKGNHSAYVRVFAEKTITAKDAQSKLDGELLCFDFNSEEWIYAEDGYYYYYKALEPESETETLFNEVFLSVTAGDAYQECTAKAKIYVQTTQAANNGTDPVKAQGWPSLPTMSDN